MLSPKSCVYIFIMACLEYLSVDTFLKTHAFSSLHAPSDPSKLCFSQEVIIMICNFGGWPQNYVTMLEAFSTSMLHCFRPAVQFSYEIAEGPTGSCW